MDLSLSLSGSLWLSVTPTLALTATLWHTLALSGSPLLSNFAYTALDRFIGPLLGSHRRCHDDQLYPALLTCTIDTFHNKMSKNGQFCPHQGHKQLTPGCMRSPLPTQVIHTKKFEEVEGIAQFYFLKSIEQKVFMITHPPFGTTTDILNTCKLVWDTFELLGTHLENPIKLLRDL